MKIDVTWLGEGFHMEAQNETDGKIRIDGKNNIGGLEGGLSPMQLLLAGIGGCSAIDVISILEKQKQPLKDLKVEVDGDRQKLDAGYSEYKSIHLHFIFSGDLNPKKVERALELSITKYCSVSKALEKGSEISYDYEITPAK
jgi:putative redox protein